MRVIPLAGVGKLNLFRKTGPVLRSFGRGLREGLTPMLGKEMRSRTRGWRSVTLLSAYLLILAAGVSLWLCLTLGKATEINPQTGLSLYSLLALALVTLLAFIAPAIAAGTISGERERRTYDLLMVTKASPLGIVLGKWLASVAYLLFLMLAALPAFAVVFLFGGVPPATIAMTLLVAAATGMGYGGLGLLFSAYLRRTHIATITSLVLIFILVFGVPVISTIVTSIVSPQSQPYMGRLSSYEQAEMQTSRVPWYTYLSPTVALSSVLPGANEYSMGGGLTPVGGMLSRVLQLLLVGGYDGGSVYGFSVGYASGTGTAGPAAWAPWARFALYQGISLVACFLLAALNITRVKPWTRWLTRRQRRRRAEREAAAGSVEGAGQS